MAQKYQTLKVTGMFPQKHCPTCGEYRNYEFTGNVMFAYFSCLGLVESDFTV